MLIDLPTPVKQSRGLALPQFSSIGIEVSVEGIAVSARINSAHSSRKITWGECSLLFGPSSYTIIL
jgi:hypothetical protein